MPPLFRSGELRADSIHRVHVVFWFSWHANPLVTDIGHDSLACLKILGETTHLDQQLSIWNLP